jgi:hypothetical protein
MGDRTPIQVIVYSCPPGSVGEVLDAFEGFGLSGGQPPAFVIHPSRHTSLELGRGYARGEIAVGSSREVAAALPTSAAWKVWEDPAYEHLGEVRMNHPDLGVFVADCDALGRPVFTSLGVDRLAIQSDGDRVQLGHLTGRTWEMAFEQLDRANNGIVLRRGATAASAPLQAVALNQLASGPSWWMPADAPGQAGSPAAPDR